MSNGDVEWADGMLYPILHRLEKRKLVGAYWGVAAAAAEAALAALPAGDPIAPQIQARLDLYRQRRPFRQPDGVADGR